MGSVRVSPLLPCLLLLGLALTMPPRSLVLSQSPWSGDHQGSTRYDFAVHVAAGKQECYFVPARPGGDFFFTFEVQWTLGFQQENAVRAFVRSPSGRLEANLDERQRGTIEFQVTTEGAYEVCVDNSAARFGKKQVFLELGIFYKLEAAQREAEAAQRNDSLAAIEFTSRHVQMNMFATWRHYHMMRVRRGIDIYMLHETVALVDMWSTLQSVVVIGAGVTQTLLLRALFRTPQGTPRC
ncbi:transmembrane emp24 domain-containing protein 6 [Lampetra fluviatilis]